ncbi:MAG: cell wall hydrolase [Gammaproteobacteria bacterium]|nr:cell wall hydrolase [Gammaproteobacteria bacterium]
MFNRLVSILQRKLQRTRLWQMTSRAERMLAFGTLIITLPSVYVIARDAIASQRLSADIQCMAMNIYHEARGEPIAGQYAVAEVTLNRTHSREFPASVCQVVYQKHWSPQRKETVYAFSWTGMPVTTKLHSAAWRQAREIARTVLTHRREPTMQGALYYHSTSVKPEWSRHHKRLAIIGRHIFYM